MNDINQFTFYWSYKNAIADLSDGEKLEVYEAITNYAFFGEEPELKSALSVLCWKLIRPHIERSRKNGGRGGCPIGSKKPTMLGNQNARKNKTETKPKQNRQKQNPLEVEEEKEEELGKGLLRDAQHPNTPKPSTEASKFLTWMQTNYPHVCKMEQPLTMEEYKKLEQDVGTDAVCNILSEMENYKPLTKKNRNAYMTALKWLKMKGGAK